MADLIIRNGSVVDGTGAAPRYADVAITGGRITEIGRALAGRGNREIDADGMIVTPGFVDIHTHFDGQATWDGDLAPSSNHGVTSIVMGNCGVGFAPAKPTEAEHNWLIGLLEGVEDIPGTALAEGLPWDWETFPEYLDALGRRSYVVDVGTQVAHAPLPPTPRTTDPHDEAHRRRGARPAARAGRREPRVRNKFRLRREPWCGDWPQADGRIGKFKWSDRSHDCLIGVPGGRHLAGHCPGPL